jgi:hypothetical protein
MRKLGEDHTTFVVNGTRQTPKAFDQTIIVNAKLKGRVLSALFNEQMPGDDKPRAAARQIAVEADVVVCDFARDSGHRFASRGADQPIAQCEWADSSGLEVGAIHFDRVAGGSSDGNAITPY